MIVFPSVAFATLDQRSLAWLSYRARRLRDHHGLVPREDRSRGPEPLDDAVDAERQLPEELGDCRDGLKGPTSLDRVEGDGDPGDHDERTSDQTEHRHP